MTIHFARIFEFFLSQTTSLDQTFAIETWSKGSVLFCSSEAKSLKTSPPQGASCGVFRGRPPLINRGLFGSRLLAALLVLAGGMSTELYQVTFPKAGENRAAGRVGAQGNTLSLIHI